MFFHAGSQRWAYAVSLGKDENGKRLRVFLYAKTRSELQSKIMDERTRGGGTIQPRIAGTLGDWVTEWLTDTVKPNRSAATYESYEAVWRVHVKPIVGGVKLEELGVSHVSALLRRLRKDGVSASMIDRILRVMHRALTVAIRQGRFNRPNPFALVDRPKLPPPETRSLSIEEARRLVAAAAGDRFEALWILLITCGMRLGEALALRWSDVDLKARKLTIHRSRSQVGRPHDKDTKNVSSRREVSFGALAAQALERRRQAADKEPHRSPVIFCTSVGTVILRENLRRSHFKPLLKRAKVAITIRELRHSSISIGLAAGVPVKAMSGRSGHANSRTTLDRYTRVLAGQDRAAAAAIDAALVPKRRKPKAPARRQSSR